MADHYGDDDVKRGELVRKAFFEEISQKREGKGIERMIPDVKLGPQQDFPAGSYGPEDQGALAFAVGHDQRNKKVFLEFGVEVKWLAMDPEQAVNLAEILIQYARELVNKVEEKTNED